MATPADAPRRRWRDRDNPRPRPRRCPHFDCSTKIEGGRFACGRHWRMLPEALQADLKANFPRRGAAGLPDDDPFRVAARAARTVWREAE